MRPVYTNFFAGPGGPRAFRQVWFLQENVELERVFGTPLTDAGGAAASEARSIIFCYGDDFERERDGALV
jgi:hypothetical protein